MNSPLTFAFQVNYETTVNDCLPYYMNFSPVRCDHFQIDVRNKKHRGRISPGSLSILITMLRHNMAAISEIGDFRTRSALFVICSVILELSTHSSIRESRGRNELHVCQRWRMKAKDEEANFTREENEHYRFCVQIRYVFLLCR